MTSKKIPKWFEEFPVYLNRFDGVLNDYLSPLTEFALNVANQIIGERHLIIAVPSAVFYPLPIVSYLAAKKTKRTILANTTHLSTSEEDPLRLHHENYYSLQGNGQNFCFYNVPIAYIKKNTLIVDFYLPYANRNTKRQFKEKSIIYLKKIYSDKDRAKILLHGEGRNSRIFETFEKLTINGNIIDMVSHSDIKVIIFENLDRIIYTEHKLEIFLEWIKFFDKKGIKTIIHISNPNLKLILPLKEKMNALMLHFGMSLLKNNLWIKNRALNYFNSENKFTKFNIDNKFLYEGKQRFIIQKPLPQGNIDINFHNALKNLEQVNIESLPDYVKLCVYRLKSLVFGIFNLFINPSRYYLTYYNQTEYQTHEIGLFLRYLNKVIKTIKNQNDKNLLHRALIEFNSIFNELKECKTCIQSKNYNRKSKNYALFEYLNNAEPGQYVIAADRMERKILKSNLQTIHNKMIDWSIKTLDQLQNSLWNTSNSILILPGAIFPKYMSILFIEWKKVIIFAYEGMDLRRINKQIELIKKLDIKEEQFSIECLVEISKYLGISKINPISNDFNKRMTQIQVKKLYNEKNVLNNNNKLEYISINEIIGNIIKTNPYFTELKEHQEVFVIDEEKNNIFQEKIYNSEITNQDYYTVTLYDELLNKQLTKNLQIDKSYIFLKNRTSNKVETTFPRHLKKGNYIIFIDQDERKSMIDLISSQLDSDIFIDFKIIEKWQSRLGIYFEDHYRKVNDFYKDYFNTLKNRRKKPRKYATFANWVRGKVTYTKDPNDLYYLGLLMNDSFFLDEYQNIYDEGIKINSFHRNLSKKLHRIITQVLEHNIDVSKLTLDEYEIYRRIEKSIFLIENIFKHNSKEV